MASAQSASTPDAAALPASPAATGPRASGRAPSPTSPPKTPEGRAFLRRALDPRVLTKVALLAGAGIWLFWTWLATQSQYSVNSGDWSHAFFVPVICGYLLWHHRGALDRITATVFWPGIVPIVMGVWSYVFFIVGVPNHLGQGLAMTLTAFGLALLLLGPKYMTYLFFPIAYLFFAITIPEKVMNHATWPLQRVATLGGWVGLRMLGVNTDIAGNQLTVYDTTTFQGHELNVAEACSGMRMLIAFLALGVAVALVSTRLWWKRVVLIGLAAPLAVLLNVVRIIVLGLASQVNQNLSAGQAHMFIGTLLLFPGFVLYMMILVSLNKAVPETTATVAGARKHGPRGAAA